MCAAAGRGTTQAVKNGLSGNRGETCQQNKIQRHPIYLQEF